MSSQLTSYPAYKPTGLPWLPQIPEHWETIKIRELFVERNQKVSDKDYPPLSVSKGGVVPQIASVAKTDNGDNRKLVMAGDFVINSRSDRKGSSGVSEHEGSVSLINLVLKPRTARDKRFLHYLLKSLPFVEEFYRNGRGIVADLWTTRYSEMKTISLPIPMPDEQTQIVRYLDSMTAKINKQIRAKKKQIALLQEQKQAIINQAVTKGLNPNAEMKDSGIDWLGKIPKLWSVKFFSKVASIKSNLVRPEDYYDYPQVSPEKIEKNTGRLFPVSSVRDSGIISNNHLFFKGQILYSKIRPLLNKLAIAPFDGLCSADMYPIETILNTEYLKFFMLSSWFLYQIKQSGDRVKMPKINQQEMAKLLIVVPSNCEQEDIVHDIRNRWEKIDNILRSLEEEIKTLEEYKDSLISAVVAGQIDVRNIPVDDFDPADLVSETEDDPEEENSTEENEG